MPEDIPPGLCQCGCGEPTKLAKASNRSRGHVIGQPLRFLHGHNRTRLEITPADYDVEDRGYQTPCWIWTHYLDGNGYGKVAYRGQVVLAHRRNYEQEVGPIPDDLELDHLCRVPSCIRFDHVEPVTHTENVRRGLGNRYDERTHCVNGHKFTPANTRIQLKRNGDFQQRVCRICERAAGKRYREGSRPVRK